MGQDLQNLQDDNQFAECSGNNVRFEFLQSFL